jgi:hypothetical protein
VSKTSCAGTLSGGFSDGGNGRAYDALMGAHDKPKPEPKPNDPPGNQDGKPEEVAKPGDGTHKK